MIQGTSCSASFKSSLLSTHSSAYLFKMLCGVFTVHTKEYSYWGKVYNAINNPSNLSSISILFLTERVHIVQILNPHTQTIRRLLPTICLSMFDHFVGLALKCLTNVTHFMPLVSRYTSWKGVFREYRNIPAARHGLTETFFDKLSNPNIQSQK